MTKLDLLANKTTHFIEEMENLQHSHFGFSYDDCKHYISSYQDLRDEALELTNHKFWIYPIGLQANEEMYLSNQQQTDLITNIWYSSKSLLTVIDSVNA